MSTRCNIHFTYRGRVEANVYRHSDGYPDGEHGVPASLARFFTAVQEQTQDTRFGDPTYLAAKFVVWQAGEYAKYGNGNPLDFLSVGVTNEDAGDGEYIYQVECGNLHEGLPLVSWEDAA